MHLLPNDLGVCYDPRAETHDAPAFLLHVLSASCVCYTDISDSVSDKPSLTMAVQPAGSLNSVVAVSTAQQHLDLTEQSNALVPKHEHAVL